MALGFSGGLLTGLQQFGQGGGAMPSDPRQRNAIQAAGVTNPLLQQFGMGLGGLLGTDMRSPAEIEREKKTQAFTSAFETSTKGTAAAQSGNVEGLNASIADLTQKMSEAGTLEEKQLYASQIQELQRLAPTAQKTATTNKAKSILTLEQTLEAGTVENEEERTALQTQIDNLKKDPEAVRQYNQFKMDQWRTEKAAQEMEAEQWIKSNANSLTQAIQTDDFETVESILGKAGDYSEAAQAFVSRVSQNTKTLRDLEQNSLENKVEPNVDLWQEKIDNLPEEVKGTFEPMLRAYKNVSKGYNENSGTWNTGARLRAKQIEKEMSGLYSNMINQLAVSDFSMKRREEAKKAEQIKDLELKIDVPMDSSYMSRGRTLAASLLGEKEELTMPMIRQAARSLYEQDQALYRSQLATLKGEPLPKAEDTTIPVGTIDSGYEFLGGDPNNPDNWREVTTSSDGAFGTNYMSTESLAPERAYLERIRSNISPLGTYTQ